MKKICKNCDEWALEGYDECADCHEDTMMYKYYKYKEEQGILAPRCDHNQESPWI